MMKKVIFAIFMAFFAVGHGQSFFYPTIQTKTHGFDIWIVAFDGQAPFEYYINGVQYWEPCIQGLPYEETLVLTVKSSNGMEDSLIMNLQHPQFPIPQITSNIDSISIGIESGFIVHMYDENLVEQTVEQSSQIPWGLSKYAVIHDLRTDQIYLLQKGETMNVQHFDPVPSVSVYPNPTSASTTISVTGVSGKVRIAVVDMNGREVASETLECSTDCVKTMDVEKLAQGAYFVLITNKGSLLAAEKIVVQ